MLKPAYGEKSFNSHSQDSVQGASQSDLKHFFAYIACDHAATAVLQLELHHQKHFEFDQLHVMYLHS